jgi:hypothetical protein
MSVHITRRSVVAAFVGVSVTGSAAVPKFDGLDRMTLDLGHRGTRAGPVAVLPDGAVLWITTEPEPPYLAKAMWPISRLTLRRSRDGGRSWGEPKKFLQGTHQYSLLSHALRVIDSRTLLHIFVRYSGYDYETASPAKSLCEVFAHRSVDGGETWEQPRKLPTGERYNGDVLSVEQMRDGRLIYPFAFLTPVKGQFACSVLFSDDGGVSWTRSKSVLQAGGGGFESGANEPSVVELPDGKLWMLIRAQSGVQWQSFSTDRGETWTPAQPSRIPSSNAPATALRLQNGKIAVAWNNDVQSNYARQSLVLGVASDGTSFESIREIDGTDFPDSPAEPALHVTYPYLAETQDGRILVAYNKGHWMRHNRPALARVHPGWLLSKSEHITFEDGRTGWHTVNPGPKRTAATERYQSSADGLWLEIAQSANSSAAAGITRNIRHVKNGTVRAVLHAVQPEAYLVFGDSLLYPGAVDAGILRIRWTAESALIGAGSPERVDRPRGTTLYSFVHYPVRTEKLYPRIAGEVSVVSVRFNADGRKAFVQIGDGPEVVLETAAVLGINYVGLAVSGAGLLRMKELRVEATQ